MAVNVIKDQFLSISSDNLSGFSGAILTKIIPSRGT